MDKMRFHQLGQGSLHGEIISIFLVQHKFGKLSVAHGEAYLVQNMEKNQFV